MSMIARLARPFIAVTWLALVAVPGARAIPLAIPGTTTVHGGHTYLLLELGTWTEAEASAVGLGGHLVKIEDAAENDFVTSYFGSIIFRPGSGDLWIGLTDEAHEGTFVWSDGSPLSGYTNWALHPDGSTEPNNCTLLSDGSCFPENYVHIGWWAAGGVWNDIPQYDPAGNPIRANGVVEIDSVVPEPSSLVLLALGLAGAAVRRRRGV